MDAIAAIEGTDIENNPVEILRTIRSRVMGDLVPDLLLLDDEVEEDLNEIEVSRFSILDSLDEIGLIENHFLPLNIQFLMEVRIFYSSRIIPIPKSLTETMPDTFLKTWK